MMCKWIKWEDECMSSNSIYVNKHQTSYKFSTVFNTTQTPCLTLWSSRLHASGRSTGLAGWCYVYIYIYRIDDLEPRRHVNPMLRHTQSAAPPRDPWFCFVSRSWIRRDCRSRFHGEVAIDWASIQTSGREWSCMHASAWTLCDKCNFTHLRYQTP